MKKYFLEADDICLRKIAKSDLDDKFLEWYNDKKVTHYLFMGILPQNPEDLQNWFEQMQTNNKEIVFIVINKKNMNKIGFCGLHQINWIARTAEYRIFICERQYWGKGIGVKTTKTILRYGFELLNLNKIWLGVNIEHKKAVSLYKNCGFTEEGILRKEIYRNSRYYDALRMSILRDEYYAKYKKNWDREIKNHFETDYV